MQTTIETAPADNDKQPPPIPPDEPTPPPVNEPPPEPQPKGPYTVCRDGAANHLHELTA